MVFNEPILEKQRTRLSVPVVAVSHLIMLIDESKLYEHILDRDYRAHSNDHRMIELSAIFTFLFNKIQEKLTVVQKFKF